MVRIFRHYVSRTLMVLGATEALILFGSAYLGISVRVLDFNPTSNLLVGSVWSKAFLYAIFMMVTMAAVGLYQRGLHEDLRDMVFRIGLAFMVGFTVLGTAISFHPQLSVGRTAFFFTFLYSGLGVAVFRVALHKYSGSRLFKRRVLIFGAGKVAAQLEGLRHRSDWHDLLLLGYISVPDETVLVEGQTVFAKDGTLLSLARKLGADEFVVAVDERRRHFPISEILDCKMHGIRVTDLADFFERQTGRINVDTLSPGAMIFSDGFFQAVLKTYLHRGLDLLVSFIVLALTWPIMLVFAILIYLESGAPVFYQQVRVGRDGKPFTILKFRSMVPNAEAGGVRWAEANDSRVTAVGRLIRKARIDELPQIINVLKGDMSFVGPRPERPEFVERLNETIPFYELRHRVNPGITGWAQVCYPYGASDDDAKEKLQYDLYYIKNYSLFLDLMIIIQTAQVILWGKGAR